MPAVASAVRSDGEMPVPPEVITTSTFSLTAALSAATTSGPSATTTGVGVVMPCWFSHSTMIGPVRSSYTPAAARVEAITTRPDRVVNIVCSSRERSTPRPQPRLAAFFSQHPDVVNAGGGVNGLDHVEERQRGDADGGQRLHLDACAIGGANGGGDVDVSLADLEVDIDSGQRQRVAQRDEVAGPLGGQDARHPRGGQRVAFR